MILLPNLLACGPAPTPPCPPDTCVDDDGDGYTTGVDCDDGDASHHPGADEVPGDGVDQDCSGTDGATATSLGEASDGGWQPPVAFVWAGRRLSAGDVDGDGADELVVSAPGPIGCGFEFVASEVDRGCYAEAEYGHVWVLRRDDGVWTDFAAWVGPDDSSEAIGEYIDATGDLDGDGRADVLTGSREASVVFFGPGPWPDRDASSESLGGNAYVHGAVPDDDGDGADSVLLTGLASETQDGLILWRDWSRARADYPDLVLLSPQPHDDLARTPPAFPDLDGDGVPEWLFGAALHDSAGGPEAGAVYAVPAGLSGTMPITHVAASWVGAVAGGEAGLDVANAGDTDGDGLDEALVGAPLDDTPGRRAGRVFVVSGLPAQPAVLDEAAAAVVEAELESDWLGWRLTGPVDADRDGFADLVLGAPGDIYSRLNHPGKVHLLLGPLAGTVSAGDAAMTWTGDQLGASAGAGLALGDFDGDGQTDLAVGAARMPGMAGDDAGHVYVLLAFGADLAR